jgi:hypothetical protein
MQYLLKYMPEPKDSRRQIADPTNEPDFESISRLYPVPPPVLPTLKTAAASNTVGAVTSNSNSSSGSGGAGTATGSSSTTSITSVPMQARKASDESTNVAHAEAVGSTTGNATTSASTASTSAASSLSVAAAAVSNQRIGMDRNAAMAEIQSLRARLASEVLGNSERGTSTGAAGGRDSPEPPAKRQACLASGLFGQTPVRQLARMPNPFPTRARGLSQLEAMLQRNTMVSGIRKQKEQEAQQQQQYQEQQVQQKFQEFLAQQQQLEEIQQQRQLSELKTKETHQQQLQTHQQQLQTQHAIDVQQRGSNLALPPQQQQQQQQPRTLSTSHLTSISQQQQQQQQANQQNSLQSQLSQQLLQVQRHPQQLYNPPPPAPTTIPNFNMAAFHNFQSQGGVPVASPSQQMPIHALASSGLNMMGMTNLAGTTTNTAATQQMPQAPTMVPPDMGSNGVVGDYWRMQKFQSAPHFP